ncbi:MAG: aminotransferase class I/II-fold pyridoxal phosphate-dependent enzyme [Candidatus Diapherotrites archaeon]
MPEKRELKTVGANLQKKKTFKFGTRAVHEIRVEALEQSPAMPSIYQTSTFAFQHAEDLGKKISSGPNNEVFVYTRGSNPTQRTLEKTVAAMEGSEDAICTCSGMAAITLIAITFLKQGDHAIAGNVTYGDTHNLFENILSRFGIETSFVDTTKVQNIKKALKPNTKMVFFETPSNPLLRLTDIKAVSRLTKPKGIKLVVDNSLMSPLFQQPIKHGADISVHSLTKYLNGHSDVLGGIILCSKKDRLALRSMLFTTGPVLDPHAAWLVLRGIKTLEVRMKKHEANALKIVEFLYNHPKVQNLRHPAIPGHPDSAIAKKQMSGMPAVLSFELKGGYRKALAFINRLKLFKRAVSLGGVESLAEHPASMTHAIIPKAQRKAIGITDSMVRLSIGIEDAEDLVLDLKQALRD